MSTGAIQRKIIEESGSLFAGIIEIIKLCFADVYACKYHPGLNDIHV